KILPEKKHRLDRAHIAGSVLKQQIAMFKIALQRLFDDLVVTIIFTLVPERSFPRIAFLEFRQLQNLRYAVSKLDCIAVLHGNQPVWLVGGHRGGHPTMSPLNGLCFPSLRRFPPSAPRL